MTIQNYSDKSRYLLCREGINFFYFGEGCIADYYGDSVAFLDCEDIKIVTLCRNGIREKELIAQFDSLSLSGMGVLERVKRLKKKGVLVERDKTSDVQVSFWGEEGRYYPKELTIELTDTCNYFCPFCYKSAKKDGMFISDRTIEEIDLLIRGKVHNITLSGGEPTIHPNYLKYIDIFSEYADVSMLSNGSRLFEHDSSVLKKLSQIQFSIYGCNNAEYEKMTGCIDGYTRLCKSVELALNNDIETVLALTFCDSTMDHLEEFVEAVIRMGVGVLRIGMAEPFGRGKYLNDFMDRADEINGMMAELKRRYRKQIIIDYARVNAEHVSTHEDLVKHVHRGTFNCGNGSQALVISKAGFIRPCAYLPEECFSVEKRNALEEHISGDFHATILRESIRRYLTECSPSRDCQLCGAIEDYILREKL